MLPLSANGDGTRRTVVGTAPPCSGRAVERDPDGVGANGVVDLAAFGLSASDAALLRPHLSVTSFARGALVQEAGPVTSHCHLVTSGLASVTCPEHGGIEVSSVMASDVVGVQALLGGSANLFPIHAVTVVTCLTVHHAALAQCMSASATLRDAMMGLVDKRLTQLLSRAACHAVHDCGQRLAAWILRHEHAHGGPLRVTHSDLARLLGVRRATVTDSLHVLEGRHAVRTHRRRITVRDAQALRLCACDCHGDLPPAAGGTVPEDGTAGRTLRTRPRGR